MNENNTPVQRAILAAADLGQYDMESSLDELDELADTAGAQVVARIYQRRTEFDKATCIGSGRLEELRAAAYNMEADLVIFDNELTGSQLRNIENAVGVRVIDRTMLILDIFAQRAVTSEGKLQVELAQQRYFLPRLTGLSEGLSRLGGGIGTRGPGESKLESDRRHIRRRITALEEKLKELTFRRGLVRERRKKEGVLTAAIVGYTNAGKSTLLNVLTGAHVMTQDRLFATLDPTSRAVELPDGREVILTDTVGLIRRLPHHLVEAFKSTLEEAANADLILNVCDISDPDVQEHAQVTMQLLDELGAGEIPVLTIYNKCDAMELPVIPIDMNTVVVSAQTGFGLEGLLNSISQMMTSTQKKLRLMIPYTQGALVGEILQQGKIYTQEYTENGILLDALVDCKMIYKLDNMILL